MRQFFHHFTEQNKCYFTEHFEQIRVVWLGGLRVLDLQSEGLESTVHWISPSPEFNSIAMLVIKCHVLLLASWDSNTCYVTFKLFNHLFLSLLICGQQKWKILGSLQNRRFFFSSFSGKHQADMECKTQATVDWGAFLWSVACAHVFLHSGHACLPRARLKKKWRNSTCSAG